MNTIDVAYLVAKNMTTRTEYKKHGSYLIYEDDKVQISYDTYYPNLDVSIRMDDKWKLVLMRNGHGFNQEYHPGAWEEYIKSLAPKAIEAKERKERERLERERKEREAKFAPVDDSKIFCGANP